MKFRGGVRLIELLWWLCRCVSGLRRGEEKRFQGLSREVKCFEKDPFIGKLREKG